MQSRVVKIFLIVLSAAAVLSAINFVISINIFSNNLLEKNLEKYTGLNFEFVEPKIKLDHHFNLKTKAKAVNVYSEDKILKIAEIDNPDITIKPLGLIFKKINVNNFSADKIKVNILRDENGKIEVLKNLKKQEFKISKLKTNIADLEIDYIDNYKIKSKTTFDFADFKIKYVKDKKILSLYQKGEIKTQIGGVEKTAKFLLDVNDGVFDINFDNIDAYLFSDIAKRYISKDISSLSGNLNLICKIEDSGRLVMNLENLVFNLADGTSVAPYKNIKINSDFKTDSDRVEIKNLKITSDNLDINVSGKISRLFKENVKTDLVLEFNKTQLNNFLIFIPDNAIFFNPKGIPYLKKTNFHGIVDGKVSLKYSPLNMIGDVKVSNVHIPQYQKSFKPNDVYLTFKKDKLYVKTRVYTPVNEYVDIDGYSNLDDSLYGNYNAKSTQKIDLAFAQKYLVDVQQVIGFNIGPVPIMKISGYGNIDINAKNTLEDPQVTGYFKAYGADVELQGVDAKLTGGSCNLLFDNRDLIFQDLKANFGSGFVFMSGKSNNKGDVDIDVKVSNAFASQILKVFNNSLISKPYAILTKDIAATSGKTNFLINLKGTVGDFEKPEFLLKLTPTGSIEFFENKIVLNNGAKIKDVVGMLNFGQKQLGIFEFMINNSKVNVQFNSSDNLEKISSGNPFNLDFSIFSNKMEFGNISKEFRNIIPVDVNFYFKTDLKGNVELSLNDLKNIKLNSIKGYITGLNSSINKNIKFNSGFIKFRENKMFFDNVDFDLAKGNMKIKGYAADFLKNNPDLNLDCLISHVDLSVFPNLKSLNYSIENAKLEFRKDKLKLDNLRLNLASTPILLNAKIDDIYKDRNVNADFLAIVNENIVDTFINPFLSYPVKIKENVTIKGKFKGNIQNYLLDFDLMLPENSDIFYMGANIGDTNYQREITGKIAVNQDVASFNNLKITKFVQGQQKLSAVDILLLNGKILQKKDGVYFNNFKIDTLSPINAQVLNVLFKKSILKQGQFECNLNLNGSILMPNAIGKLILTDLDIPLYNTQINNIKFNFAPKYIDGEIFAKNQKSDFKALIRAKNSLKPPYIVDIAALSSNKININEIMESLPKKRAKSDITLNKDFSIKPSDIIIKNGSFDFKEVSFNKIEAKNVKGNFTYNNSMFNMQNIVFDIAQGMIGANGKYNLLTTELDLNAVLVNCEANLLTKQFLNFQGQIYGKLNGNLDFSVKNLNTPEGIKNIKSDINFEIKKGKMPKLGSLEYLLRADNTIRGGFLGLSLNNLMHILTPYKTGEFENIKGNLTIKDAKIKNLEIKSKGKNLSLYLEGDYDILDTIADIKIFGKLSQNVTNALSSITNASFKQLVNFVGRKKQDDKQSKYSAYFEKIPSTEGQDSQPMYFRVKVLGDINKDDYVKEFVWE